MTNICILPLKKASHQIYTLENSGRQTPNPYEKNVARNNKNVNKMLHENISHKSIFQTCRMTSSENHKVLSTDEEAAARGRFLFLFS